MLQQRIPQTISTILYGPYDISYILPWPIIYGPWKIILLTYEKWYDLWMAWISCWNISLLSPLDTSSGVCSLIPAFLIYCMLFAALYMLHTIWLLLLSTSREFWKRTNPWKSVLLQDDLIKYYSFDGLSLFFDVQVLEIIEQEWPWQWSFWCLESNSRDPLIPRVPKILNLVTATGRLKTKDCLWSLFQTNRWRINYGEM